MSLVKMRSYCSRTGPESNMAGVLLRRRREDRGGVRATGQGRRRLEARSYKPRTAQDFWTHEELRERPGTDSLQEP